MLGDLKWIPGAGFYNNYFVSMLYVTSNKYKWGFSLAHNIQYIIYICIRIGCALLWVYHNS